jgi:hypothetical protein
MEGKMNNQNSRSVGTKAVKIAVIIASLAVMTACGPSESEDESQGRDPTTGGPG